MTEVSESVSGARGPRSSQRRLCVKCESHLSTYSGAFTLFGGRDSSVGIATRYGLDGPGIESRWGRDFPHPSWDPPSLLYNGYRVFPGGKAAGAWCYSPPHLQCRGLKLGRAIPLPTLRALLVCIGRTLTFTLA